MRVVSFIRQDLTKALVSVFTEAEFFGRCFSLVYLLILSCELANKRPLQNVLLVDEEENVSVLFMRNEELDFFLRSAHVFLRHR